MPADEWIVIDMVDVRERTTPARTATSATAPAAIQPVVVPSLAALRTLSILRLATGFIFLWAFLDKTFGLGFSTPSDRAWIHGGTPAQGFLNSPAVTGPFKDFFVGIASPLVDVLFMLGMLGVGVAIMLGIGTRISAAVGSLIMVFMYLAEWVFTPLTSSTNPLVDYHIVYALALIVVAVFTGGDTWGLGRMWKNLSIVQKYRWLI
jgi:thiosulfate dehydrogenase [quinone] large subunit